MANSVFRLVSLVIKYLDVVARCLAQAMHFVWRRNVPVAILERKMRIQIAGPKDVAKLLAFVRANAKAEFVFAEHMTRFILEELKRFAQNADISVEVVNPSEERVFVFTAGGLVVGGAAGLALAGPYGLLIGMTLGACGGFAAAHVVVKIDIRDGQGRLIVQ